VINLKAEIGMMAKVFLQVIPAGFDMVVAELPPSALETIKRASAATVEFRRAEAASIVAERAARSKAAHRARRFKRALRFIGAWA
jgi:hypothetical protein